MPTFKGIAFRGIYAVLIAVQLSLTGCALVTDRSAKYELKEADPKKGIVVGTVFERSAFTPYGADFHFVGPGKEPITVSSGAANGRYTIFGTPPKEAKGVGKAFALQLEPGKYRVFAWSLNYGSMDKYSEIRANAVEFEVVAGKTVYLGRFDANRFLEVASIHDNFDADLPHLKKLPLLKTDAIENKSLSERGWWLKNPTGKELLEKTGHPNCEQC